MSQEDDDPKNLIDNRLPERRWLYFVLILMAISIAHSFWDAYHRVAPLPYSEFVRQLKAGNVKAARIDDTEIRGGFVSPLPDGSTEFTVVRVDPQLARDLQQFNLAFEGTPSHPFLQQLIGWIVPTIVFIALWQWFLRKSASGGGLPGTGMLNIGRSRAKVFAQTDIREGFSDVAGVDEAKAELQEVVEFLRDPGAASRLGGRAPRGILLVGPPGTGKTLLARAVAGEAHVPFLSINGSEFVEMFVGVGAARVRDLFEQARKLAPAIIFIDEIDALGRARGAYMLGGHDEKEQTLNQLLAELDGFDRTSGVVLLAATNRPEILDPALLRAGRFDRQVLVDRPDREGRLQILRVHARKVQLAQSTDLDQIAAMTPGFSGADLANLVNEAALVATRRRAAAVSADDFGAALERIVGGLEKRNRLLNPIERKVVAHHEMGHALVSLALPGNEKLHKVSIIPRGVGALGYTIARPVEDRFLMTQRELSDRMAVLLGGRAAEELIFGEVSTGAADDLAKATDLAREMVLRFGMSEKIGPVSLEKPNTDFLGAPQMHRPGNAFSEDTARAIDESVRQLVLDARAKALEILTRQRARLEKGAALLLERETLLEADISNLAADGALVRVPARRVAAA